jgi:putative transposase
MAIGRRLSGQGTRRAKKRAADECVGKNPTDRAKPGVKKSILVEADGGPLGIAISGANTVDAQLLAITLDAVVVERPQPTEQAPQNFCLDKAYDNPTAHAATKEAGYTPHIRRIGEEKRDPEGEKRYPARRWVVERTFAWLSRCRGILVRYEKKANNYMAVLKLACALLWFRRLCRLSGASL